MVREHLVLSETAKLQNGAATLKGIPTSNE